MAARYQYPTIALLLVADMALGQSLSLFESAQTPSDDERSAMPAFQQGPLEQAPVLSLRSNSRFGDIWRSVLVDDAGNAVEVEWSAGQNTAVPQHPGYTVVGVSSGEITVQQPPGLACSPQPAAGIRCNSEGQLLLSLVTLAPLPAGSEPAANAVDAGTPVMGPQPGPDNVLIGPDGNPVFVNPFAAAMEAQDGDAQEAGRAERARARAERLQQFQVERIPEDQVPPGMRLVRTPFGDRLVPVRQ